MITIENLYTEAKAELPDDNAVWQWAQQNTPWAFSPPPKDVDALLSRISGHQFYTVQRTGTQAPPPVAIPDISKLFRAAELLQGKLHTDPSARAARVLHEGDDVAAALAAAGIPVTEENRRSLEGIATVQGMGKAEAQEEAPLRAKASVLAATIDGRDVAQRVRHALQRGSYNAAHLGNKARHAAGSVLAEDPDTDQAYLLKPGAGKQSAAAGAAEEGASQSQREAAFWHALDRLGFGQWAPRADLVLIDQKEYACIEFLSPAEYDTLHNRYEHDPAQVRASLLPHLQDGTLHKLAALDFILGNSDRHGRNCMASDKIPLRLIDHGSALAGAHFDPAHDGNSFCPFYLRVFGPGLDYAQEHPHVRLAVLPRATAPAQAHLASWLLGLDRVALAVALTRYGVDAAPSVQRLDGLLALCVAGDPADMAINRAWAEGLPVPPDPGPTDEAVPTSPVAQAA